MPPSIKDQLDPIFRPRSVAVVGASNYPDRWGHETMYNVLNWSQFRGEVYPINPKDEFVQGLKAYKSVTDVPGPIDLAVIVVTGDDRVLEDHGRSYLAAHKGLRGPDAELGKPVDPEELLQILKSRAPMR